jgi:hypothetical protein
MKWRENLASLLHANPQIANPQIVNLQIDVPVMDVLAIGDLSIEVPALPCAKMIDALLMMRISA